MAENRLILLSEALELLERYQRTIARADLDADREAWLKAKAALELAAQCAADLALQLLAHNRRRVAASHPEAFAALAHAGVIDGELARELTCCVALREDLMQRYTTLDLDRVHSALGETGALRSFHSLAARELLHDRP